eukprot:TRINITY_DN6767_c0_g1_i6.p1 TRINITY_DN6767_c0_g1~~TRINITY_DN6767_c0_g1_i6.p1  ORF type:complete len:182 (-),score=38.79 TRINITY_DN6767_c0_g1_i6:136-681(-)
MRPMSKSEELSHLRNHVIEILQASTEPMVLAYLQHELSKRMSQKVDVKKYGYEKFSTFVGEISRVKLETKDSTVYAVLDNNYVKSASKTAKKKNVYKTIKQYKYELKTLKQKNLELTNTCNKLIEENKSSALQESRDDRESILDESDPIYQPPSVQKTGPIMGWMGASIFSIPPTDESDSL